MARRALMLREGKAPVWDRLLTMLFLAGLLHGLVILRLTLRASPAEGAGAPRPQVRRASDERRGAAEPPPATSRAQRTQTGSGNPREAVAPRTPPSSVPNRRQAGKPAGDSLSAADEGLRGATASRVLPDPVWVRCA